MGEVWRAHDTVTDRIVALKMLAPAVAQDREFAERFGREARAAAGLNHPHIVPIHTFGDIDGRLFVDMRLIQGQDLGEVLARGPLQPARAVAIVEQVAKALHAAHRIGLVHRDVKPSNILLGGNDFAYLIDFGIARGIDETGVTAQGGVIGTMPYMAPEQLKSGRIDSRTDIYALTCVLHECLTGKRPFPGEAPDQQITAHLTLPPPRPSTIRPEIPPGFDGVIAKGMAKDPAQRYATTIDLAHAAREAVVAVPPRRSDGPRWWQRKSIVIPVAIGCVLVVAGAAVGISQISSGTTATEATSTQTRRTASPSGPPIARGISLPFSGLKWPKVAVDTAGAVYVTDPDGRRVLMLPAGETSPRPLPFTDLAGPKGVAVGPNGTVYVADFYPSRVVALPAGSAAQIVLPFGDLIVPFGVGADAAGTVYAADSTTIRVLKPGTLASTQISLPQGFIANSIAVDGQGNVYATDQIDHRVAKFTSDSTSPTFLPFSDLQGPSAVAVDAAGAVYVADSDSNRVLKLANGATTPTVLLNVSGPASLAVGADKSLYVADSADVRKFALG
jgi:serine/threonine-protein kinase